MGLIRSELVTTRGQMSRIHHRVSAPCPEERIIGEVTLNERPREATQFAHYATSPQDFRAPIPAADRSMVPDLRRLSRGPKARAARPLRPRPQVAARHQASRPTRCRRAGPAQPEVVGVERGLLGGGTPALSLGAEGRRNATRLDLIADKGFRQPVPNLTILDPVA